MKIEGHGITKEQSACLQGMAILLMIYHHFFNDLTIYGEALSFWNPEMTVRMAWFGKICVGVFAFVSGYGTCRVLQKRERNGWTTCLRQLRYLLVRYWCVLLPFMGLFFALGKRFFEPKEFLLNFFCIKTSYNGAFWYVQEYGFMMILMALFDGCLRSIQTLRDKGFRLKECRSAEIVEIACYGGLVLAGSLWIGMAALLPEPREALRSFLDVIRIAFIAIFFMGWLLAKTKVYEWIYGKLFRVNVFLKLCIGLALILIIFWLRDQLADSPAYARMDFLLVPVFVLGILLILEQSSFLQKILGQLGGISAYLWLTHLFLFELTKDWITRTIHSHLLFYLVELVLDILVAALYLYLEQKIIKRKRRS